MDTLCPRCGLSETWDGRLCRFCHYPLPVAADLGSIPRPATDESRQHPLLHYLCDDPYECSFLEAILDDPDDETTRLIYADWLDERGDPRGEFVRLEATVAGLSRDSEQARAPRARLDELADALDDSWAWFILHSRRARVLNCGRAAGAAPAWRFTFACPNRWASLVPTAHDGVRFCMECRKPVYFCETAAQVRRKARAGRCVAIPSRLAGEVERAHAADELVVGRLDTRMALPVLPAVPEDEEAFQRWGEELFGGRWETPPAPAKSWWQFWK